MSPLGWIVTLAPLGFVFAMSFGVNRMSTGTLQLLFWAFAAVMGLSMSTIFLVYTGDVDRADLLRDRGRLRSASACTATRPSAICRASARS